MAGTGADPIESNQAPYFAVSLLKFSVMSICTFGLYELYWFYKNWSLIKEREKTNILPFWRAFFAFFFCYQCFSNIRAYAASLGFQQTAPAGPLAAGWIITILLSRLPNPYSLFSILAFLFMLPVQALANRINSRVSPHHDPNRRFTVWNLLWIAVAAALIILGAMGAFRPHKHSEVRTALASPAGATDARKIQSNRTPIAFTSGVQRATSDWMN